MENLILELFTQFGSFAVFLLILLENLFPPIPSELVLTMAGYLSQLTNIHVIEMILFATLGSLIGAWLLYALGYFISYERLLRLLHLSTEKLQSSFNWYEKYQTRAVFVGRLIPIVRSLISIPAGLAHMPLFAFSVTTFLGSVIWNSLLIIAGAILGENHKLVLDFMETYQYLMIILILIVTIYIVIRKYRQK